MCCRDRYIHVGYAVLLGEQRLQFDGIHNITKKPILFGQRFALLRE
ncbi:hypothetical protein O23A_p1446 [Aeromonas salmonicida]|nr:hypothetical protein O23A_p1446 [Aeromonas salmonicida]